MNLTESTIREILATVRVYPDCVENNDGEWGEWVVWYGMGYPVDDVDDVEALAERLAHCDDWLDA